MSDATQDELDPEAIRQGVRNRAEEIKLQLFRWIGHNSGPADAVPMTIALLEIAIEGHMVITETVAPTCRRYRNVRSIHSFTGRTAVENVGHGQARGGGPLRAAAPIASGQGRCRRCGREGISPIGEFDQHLRVAPLRRCSSAR
jgi:hypothetical protein